MYLDTLVLHRVLEFYYSQDTVVVVVGGTFDAFTTQKSTAA